MQISVTFEIVEGDVFMSDMNHIYNTLNFLEHISYKKNYVIEQRSQ